MKNKDNKEKNNNLVHILALTAILALLICLGIVLLIKASKKNKSYDQLAGLEESVESNNKEDMIGRLDEVQKYLEELESSVNEGSLALDTLYDTRNADQAEKMEGVIEEVSGVEKELTKIMETVKEMKTSLSDNREYDNDVMYNNFLEVYNKVDELNKQITDVFSSLDGLENNNKIELITNIENIKKLVESQNQQNSEKMNTGFTGLNDLISGKMSEVTSLFNSKTTEMNNSLTGKMNAVDSNLTGKLNAVDNSISGKLSDVDNSISGKMNAMNTNLEGQLGNVNTSINGKLDSLINQIEAGFAGTKTDMTLGLNGLLEAINARFDGVDSSLEQVFQYVASGKRKIASALATIGTDVEKEDGADEYKVLPFDELCVKISHSQDVSGQYNDGNSDAPLVGAIEDSISLGKAAWVEGRYIIGNGNDNQAAYNRGYDVGYADGIARVYNARIEYTRHYHTGSSSSYGGCYTSPVYHQHGGECYRTYQTNICYCSSGVDYNNDGYCDGCEHSPHAGNTCLRSESHSDLICNKGNSVEGYNVGCGMSNGQILSAHINF